MQTTTIWQAKIPSVCVVVVIIRQYAFLLRLDIRNFFLPFLIAFCNRGEYIYEKFAKAVPLYRQEKDFNSKGVPLLRATMSDWVCIAAEQWCLPVYEKMRAMLIAGNIIHADESVLQVLHEAGRKATTD